MTARRTSRIRHASAQSGFSLVEVLVATAMGTVIIGSTLTALTHAMRANDAVLRLTAMNHALRSAMDLMVRDFLQVGSGLPPGHAIATPAGAGSSLLRLPGPPGTAFTNSANDTDLAAIVPGTGRGPVINGVATDTITILAADNTFTDVGVTAVSNTSIILPNGVDIGSGPDRVVPGQLMMITKGSFSTLVQVTDVNQNNRVLRFDSGDSLNLNQPSAGQGSLASLNAAAPPGSPANIRVTRIRMITYYIDATVTDRPRLVRRINNGDPLTFDNTLGTVVGNDIENLRISYDLADGASNPSNVRFTAADLDGSGACAPNPCTATQIRKINIALTARSSHASEPGARLFRNTLSSQVSLRSMAFVNQYQTP
jgi:prepilin-type N-terminal cleavage/methylation domain-containing protein